MYEPKKMFTRRRNSRAIPRTRLKTIDFYTSKIRQKYKYYQSKKFFDSLRFLCCSRDSCLIKKRENTLHKS